MSTQGPQDPSGIEYLSQDETARPRSGSGRRRTALGMGAAALVVLGGAGTYGLTQFMSSGDSAATAVPDHALGYLSLDLDPSGGQKLAAYETMRKFPALKEQLGLESDDDPRRWVVDAINDQAPTACQLDFEDEVKPWVGDEVAFSVVKTVDGPQPFFVLEVSDPEAGEKTVEKLFTCDGPADEYGTAIVGDFMVVAPDGRLAQDIAADAEESSLADDDTFNARLDDVGDEGIITGYLAPAAVDTMMEQAEGMESDLEASPGAMPGADPFEEPETGGMVPPVGSGELDAVRDQLEDFEGAAMQVRFADEGVEMEMAASGIDQVDDLEPGDSGMGDLPATTAIAYGIGISDGAVAMMEDSIKGRLSDAEYEAEIQRFEQESGLSFPEDVETLLGDGLSLAVDGSVDFEELGAAFMSGRTRGLEIPAGLRIVTDDPAAVVEVTDKLRGLIPPGMPLELEVEEGDDVVAVGADAAYVAELAGDGDLGESAAFDDAMPDVETSLGGLYVDFDAEGWLDELVGQSREDPDALANLEPLASLGVSGGAEDDGVRLLLRLATD